MSSKNPGGNTVVLLIYKPQHTRCAVGIEHQTCGVGPSLFWWNLHRPSPPPSQNEYTCIFPAMTSPLMVLQPPSVCMLRGWSQMPHSPA